MFLKFMFIKDCTVAQKHASWKPVNNNKKQAKGKQQHNKLFKFMRIKAKNMWRAASNTWTLAPGRASDKNITGHAPSQLRLARMHGTHDTHETKTKRKQSRSPSYWEGQAVPLNENLAMDKKTKTPNGRPQTPSQRDHSNAIPTSLSFWKYCGPIAKRQRGFKNRGLEHEVERGVTRAPMANA